MQVIGTAGHVDHGKSTLIEALTGVHPDRLREEQEREMTIVLGFGWLTLPDGGEIGIVDVPGHRDFIENMLSGIGGIDAALFVIAADEGVMPQTREHLAILDLLQIQSGVIVITKTDLIEDTEWLDLVEAEVKDVVLGTVLESVPIVRVSAVNGEGILVLKETISNILASKNHRPDLGRPRLSIDRVFSMSGFGTVVTGTLVDGHIKVGDDVNILPQGLKGRVRGLQTHKHKTSIAMPGSRTAINITGINVDQVDRGDVVTLPGTYKPTRRMDVKIRLLKDTKTNIKHNTEVKLFIGASEVLARVRLLGKEILKPGESGWLQLELTNPTVAIRGDRYIIRRPSPGETLGGGEVVDPHPKRRYKRFNADIIDRLEKLTEGTPKEIMLQTISTLGITSVKDAKVQSSLEDDLAVKTLQELIIDGQVIFLDINGSMDNQGALLVENNIWQQLQSRIDTEIDRYLESNNLRLGIPREELKSKLNLPSNVFNLAVTRLENAGNLNLRSIRSDLPGSSPVPVITRPGREIHFSKEQQREIDALFSQFQKNPASPPTIKECVNQVGESIYNALIDIGAIIPVSEDVVFYQKDYYQMVDKIKQLIHEKGSVSVAQVRDHLNTSRRYTLAILEHLDSMGITIRRGDVRVLK